MLSYFNIFGCRRNLLDRLDVTYEQACMPTSKDKYYTKFWKTLVYDNNCNGAPLSNEKILQPIIIVMEETEAELERNINRITVNTSFQSPVEKRDISTINNSGNYESGNHVHKISDSEEQVDAISRSSTYSVEQVDHYLE